MVSYSGDYIAKNHEQVEIATCNTEEPRQQYRLGTVSNTLLKLYSHASCYFASAPQISKNKTTALRVPTKLIGAFNYETTVHNAASVYLISSYMQSKKINVCRSFPVEIDWSHDIFLN